MTLAFKFKEQGDEPFIICQACARSMTPLTESSIKLLHAIPNTGTVVEVCYDIVTNSYVELNPTKKDS